MPPADNLARARGWIAQALAPLYLYAEREGNGPCMLMRDIVPVCAAALAAAVWAKGEMDAQQVRHYLLGQGFEVVARQAFDHLHAQAAEVPEVPPPGGPS